MTTITVDALQFAQRLKAAGIHEKEAEAIAEVVRDAQVSADLATKHDLSLQIAETKAQVTETRIRLEAQIIETKKEIAETKADLVRWVVTVGVLQTALIAGLLMRLIPG